jgi:iron(III) transport system substrate-binding protein
VAAAKKEGSLVLFGSAAGNARVQIPAAFKEKFGITVEYVAGGARDILARLQAEQKAGQHNFDVVMAGNTIQLLQKEKMLESLASSLIHPDGTDASKWKIGRLYLDPEQPYLVPLSMYTAPLRVINIDHVKPEEVTWQGLLQPKWRGKITALDPQEGAGLAYPLVILHQLGEDYFKKLYVGQQVVFTRDTRQQADWVARGTYPISLGMDKGEFARLKQDGFSVAMLPNTKDVPGISTAGTSYVGLLTEAPHPHAARLFINWLITKEGHEAFNRIAGLPGMRRDLSDSWALKETILQPGWNYLDSDAPSYQQELRPKYAQRIKELLSR